MIFLFCGMKNKSFAKEIIVSVLLIALLTLFLEPFGFMPPMAVMSLGLITLVVFAVLASFVWHEKATDEREALHSFMAGRIAFLAGIGTILAAIITQSWQHKPIDIWLLIVLSVMVIAKLGGHIYTEIKQ